MSTPERQMFPTIPGYRLIEEIGRGATSRVYRASQDALDREVAVKVITTLGESGKRRALRLFREARLSGALDHPGIVRGVDAGEEAEFCWFAMDLVDGEGLDEWIEREGALPVPEVLALAEGVLEALDHVHRRGVTHRDIKPGNIIIDVDGGARLLDLGLARRVSDPSLTLEGGAVGTPQYMSPEQARDPNRADGRSDIFSIAATLYRAVTGVAPFEGSTIGEVLTNVLQKTPPRPSAHVPDIPQALDLVLMRALEKRPEARYQSASEMLSAIRALRTGARPAWRPSPRLRLATVGAGAVALLLIAALFGTSLLDRDPPRPAKATSGVNPATAETLQDRLDAALDRTDAPFSFDDYQRVIRLASPLGDAPAARRSINAARQFYLEEVAKVLNRWEAAGVERVRTGARDVSRDFTSDQFRRRLDAPGGPLAPIDDAPLQEELDQALKASVKRLSSLENARDERAWEAAKAALAAWDHAHRDDLLSPDTVDRALADIRNSIRLFKREDVQRVESWIARLKTDHQRRPQLIWKQCVQDTSASIKAGRLATAASGLSAGLSRVRRLVPHAREDAADFTKRIESALRTERARLRTAARSIRRHELSALPVEEQRKRLEGLRRSARGGLLPEETPSLNADREVLRRLIGSLGDAMRLRDSLLKRCDPLFEGAGASFRPVVRNRGRLEPRTLARLSGRTLLARDAVGVLRSYPIDDLLASCVADLARRVGVSVSSDVVTLLAYLDGDDHHALDSARALATDSPLKALLSELASGAVDRRIASFDREADRTAYRQLVEARRLLSSGDLDAAGKELQAMEALRRDAGWSRRKFWKRHGHEVTSLRDTIRSHENLTAAWARFDPFVRIDVESGTVRLRLPLGKETSALDRVKAPARAKLASDGVRLIAREAQSTIRPDRLPPLHVELPPLTNANIAIEFDVVFEAGPFPPGFLAVSLHDVHFVLFDSVLDGRDFRSVPLNGLERRIHRRVDVRRSGFWLGDLGDYGDNIGNSDARWRLPVDKSLRCRVTGSAGGRDLVIQLGSNPPRKLTGARRALLREGGLRITGFPTVRVSDLTLSVQGKAPSGGAPR